VIRTDGRPTIAHYPANLELRRGVEAARAALAAGEEATADYLLNGVSPTDTRDCDGYPGLVYAVGGMSQEEADRANGFEEGQAELRYGGGCPCGDPGDCSGCEAW
jgi:hypothetical protein